MRKKILIHGTNTMKKKEQKFNIRGTTTDCRGKKYLSGKQIKTKLGTKILSRNKSRLQKKKYKNLTLTKPIATIERTKIGVAEQSRLHGRTNQDCKRTEHKLQVQQEESSLLKHETIRNTIFRKKCGNKNIELA
jgi:hypothetical protein